jgi:hypothetical protein
MQRRRVNTSLDGRVIGESLRLARELSRPRADPLLHLIAAGLAGFALALLLMPRSHGS